MQSADDLDGHKGRHTDGGYGVGQRNFEVRMLLFWAGDVNVCIKYMA